MESLARLGEHCGIPEGSHFYGATTPTGLRLAGTLLAPKVGDGDRGSLRHLCALLPTLPELTLRAELLHVREARPTVRISGTNALVLRTWLDKLSGGTNFGDGQDLGGSGGDVELTRLGPGVWTLVVHRAGIDHDGYRTLTQTLPRVTIPRDAPEPDPPPPPPQVRPTITVEESGPLDHRVYRVTGRGFLPDQRGGQDGVRVRFVDSIDVQSWWMNPTESDSQGRIDHTTGPLDTGTLIRRQGLAGLTISATDRRKDPDSTPANEPLWSNHVQFWY